MLKKDEINFKLFMDGFLHNGNQVNGNTSQKVDQDQRAIRLIKVKELEG